MPTEKIVTVGPGSPTTTGKHYQNDSINVDSFDFQDYSDRDEDELLGNLVLLGLFFDLLLDCCALDACTHAW